MTKQYIYPISNISNICDRSSREIYLVLSSTPAPRELDDPKLEALLENIMDKLAEIAESCERKTDISCCSIECAIKLINQLEYLKHKYGPFKKCKDKRKQHLIAIVHHILPSLLDVKSALKAL